MDQTDLFLKELKTIASAEKQKDSEPPLKRQKVSAINEVIRKGPVALSGAQSNQLMESVNQQAYIGGTVMSAKHTLAPQIPIVSEIPLPAGYNPDRTVSDGISAGRTLVKLPGNVVKRNTSAFTSKTAHERNITKLARENPAPFVQPPQYLMNAAGEEWSDPTLSEWDPNDFRIFVGNIGPEVNDELLRSTFSRYPSFLRAKAIIDKKAKKAKGYGFVSFSDPNDYLKAMKEMQGQYIGNRPVKLVKSKWKTRLDSDKIEQESKMIAEEKRKEKALLKKKNKV